MNTRDEMIARAGQVRDLALAIMFEHEAMVHEKKPCMGNRISLLAYLAHCLGINGNHAHMDLFLDLLYDYALHCENNSPCPTHPRKSRGDTLR